MDADSPTTTPETRFREVFEQSPFSMQLLSRDGTTIGINKAWEALWLGPDGAALKALVLSGEYNMLEDPQLEAKGITAFLRRAFAGETVNIPAILYDPAELGVKGRARWVTSRASPIRDSDGNVAEVMIIHDDITDRVEAERDLRNSEERFRSLVTTISQIVWTCDSEGNLTEGSNSWGAFTGQSVSEFRGDGWLDAVHPDDRASAALAWRESRDGIKLYQTEYRLRRADGVYRLTEARAVPLTGPDGSIREWIGINTDITEERRAEQALQTNELRMRRIFDTMQQKIFTATAAGSVDYANRAWVEFSGLSEADLLGWNWTEFMHPDDVEPSKVAWGHSLVSADPLEIEQRFRRRDGDMRWHLTRAVPMIGDDGQIVMWVGSNTDIHEVKLAEAELERRLDTERRHFAILSKVAAASHMLHSATTVDAMAAQLVEMVRDILEVHQAAISLTPVEQSARAVSAASLSDKYAAFRASAASVGHAGLATLAGGGSQSLRLTQAELEALPQWQARLGDPGQAPLRGLLAVPLLGHDGSHIGLLQASDRCEGEFSAEDAAILSQLASIAASGFENARLYASLQQQHNRKDEFLAMLAHELRNPLAPIRTAADVLALAPPEPRQIRQMSSVISRQVSHMSALVDDLLDVSRVTRGLIELTREEFDVRRLVNDAIEQVQPLIAARRHTLTVVLCPEPVQVSGDYKRLVQVLSNLLNNAAKYTPAGGQLQIEVKAAADTVRFIVSDNGTGIAPDLQGFVFELFSQATRNSDRSQGGLGIGLALVKNLVELHGGDVACFSEGYGAGSTFTVTLPRLKSQHGGKDANPGDGTSAAPVTPLRVLLVDDNVDAAETLASYLDAVGHQVTVRHGGAEALDSLDQGTPDVCILDIGLPDMDGHELARRLRALPALRDTLLIAVTGYGSDTDRERSLAAGFDHHLVKPVDVRVFPELFASRRAAS